MYYAQPELGIFAVLLTIRELMVFSGRPEAQTGAADLIMIGIQYKYLIAILKVQLAALAVTAAKDYLAQPAGIAALLLEGQNGIQMPIVVVVDV